MIFLLLFFEGFFVVAEKGSLNSAFLLVFLFIKIKNTFSVLKMTLKLCCNIVRVF